MVLLLVGPSTPAGAQRGAKEELAEFLISLQPRRAPASPPPAGHRIFTLSLPSPQRMRRRVSQCPLRRGDASQSRLCRPEPIQLIEQRHPPLPRGGGAIPTPLWTLLPTMPARAPTPRRLGRRGGAKSPQGEEAKHVAEETMAVTAAIATTPADRRALALHHPPTVATPRRQLAAAATVLLPPLTTYSNSLPDTRRHTSPLAAALASI